jgi:hypothetical protein
MRPHREAIGGLGLAEEGAGAGNRRKRRRGRRQNQTRWPRFGAARVEEEERGVACGEE